MEINVSGWGGGGGEAPGNFFEYTPPTLTKNASPDFMFAGASIEFLTICNKIYRLAAPGKFSGKHVFLWLRMRILATYEFL